jgi:hypothetical protein
MKMRAIVLRLLPAMAVAVMAGGAVASTSLVADSSAGATAPPSAVAMPATGWIDGANPTSPDVPGAADDGALPVYKGLPTVSPEAEAPPPSVIDGLAKGSLPEPTAWALMVLGFGGIGTLLRSRRRALKA